MRGCWLLAAVLGAALLLPPQEATDPGELLPVELLSIYKEGEMLTVRTDTGNLGRGDNLEAALADLKASASGEIFLETADYLLLTRETRYLLPELFGILRPSAEVALGEEREGAADFLRIHSPGVTLNDIRAGGRELPALTWTEGRYHLVTETD